MKILVLGGTGFIGPHIVREALARGHNVTLFNRGYSNTDLFLDVKNLVGDRDGGLDALKIGRWDVALDNSGYVPRLVRNSADLLKDHVGRYLFTSSIAAYDWSNGEFPKSVNSKMAVWTNPDSYHQRKYYGELKAQCERLVEKIYADRATLVRPTYVAGPGDPTQRFTWWVDRINRGGNILAPGKPQASLDIIDVRDLAKFYIRLLEDDRGGAFNVSGPAGRFSYGGMLNGIRATTDSPVNFIWVDAGFLKKHDVGEQEMPLWSGDDGITEKLIENQSSIDAGLKFRPFCETAADTLDWYHQLPTHKQIFTLAGIDPEREARLLEAWQKYQLARR
jgi:2'-hydroxyisoflavone reductase